MLLGEVSRIPKASCFRNKQEPYSELLGVNDSPNGKPSGQQLFESKVGAFIIRIKFGAP